jgi:transcriptional regulator with XRE-family HTH domain
MKVGDVIASIRRRKRIGQKELAKDLEISHTYLSQIENGAKTPSIKLLNKISEKLGLPLSALLFEALDESNFKTEHDRELFFQAKPIMEKMFSILIDEEVQ